MGDWACLAYITSPSLTPLRLGILRSAISCSAKRRLHWPAHSFSVSGLAPLQGCVGLICGPKTRYIPPWGLVRASEHMSCLDCLASRPPRVLFETTVAPHLFINQKQRYPARSGAKFSWIGVSIFCCVVTRFERWWGYPVNPKAATHVVVGRRVYVFATLVRSV